MFDLLLWPKNECSVQRAEWSRVDTAASIGNRQLLIFEGEIVCFNTGVQRDVTCWGLSAIFDSELNANAWFGEEAFGQHSNIGAKLNLLSMFGRVCQIAGENCRAESGEECEKQNAKIEIVKNIVFCATAIVVLFFGCWQMTFVAARRGITTWFVGAGSVSTGLILGYWSGLALLKNLLS